MQIACDIGVAFESSGMVSLAAVGARIGFGRQKFDDVEMSLFGGYAKRFAFGMLGVGALFDKKSDVSCIALQRGFDELGIKRA